MTNHIASIGTSLDVVTGDFCDLAVAAAVLAGYRVDSEGNEIAEYAPDINNIFKAELATRIDDDDRDDNAMAEADRVLAEHGWTRTGNWEFADNALYADVEQVEPKGMRTLTTAELLAIRENLGLTEAALAKLLNVSDRTVRNWIQGRYNLPDGVEAEIRQLEARTDLEILRLREQTEARITGTAPVVITVYRTDAEYEAAHPDSRMPAAWHRAVAYQVRRQLPGVRLAYADN